MTRLGTVSPRVKLRLDAVERFWPAGYTVRKPTEDGPVRYVSGGGANYLNRTGVILVDCFHPCVANGAHNQSGTESLR